MKNGDKIKITYLPSCINAPGVRNPYIGMAGEVRDFANGWFSIFTGTSWLCAIRLKTCKYENI